MARSDTIAVRASVAGAASSLALASAAWIDVAEWPTYAVFFAFALAFSFVWLDSDAPTSVPHMATATAFVYIAGLPILFFELVARLLAYPLHVRRRAPWVIALPRPLRPLVAGGSGPRAAGAARSGRDARARDDRLGPSGSASSNAARARPASSR